MPVISKACNPFERRHGPNGVYMSCYSQISNDKKSLFRLDYPTDFLGYTNRWSPNAENFSTCFSNPFDKPHTERTITLFGEILDKCEGTGLGAMGGFVLRNEGVAHFLFLLELAIADQKYRIESHKIQESKTRLHWESQPMPMRSSPISSLIKSEPLTASSESLCCLNQRCVIHLSSLTF